MVMGMGVNLRFRARRSPANSTLERPALADAIPSGTAEELADRVQDALSAHLAGIQETGEVNFKGARGACGWDERFVLHWILSLEPAKWWGWMFQEVSGSFFFRTGKHVIFAGDVEPVEWR